MPKETFYNLNEEKKLKIIAVLKKVFREKSIFEANVKEIVETLGIARGSFYQYFENLEDAYFMILDLETKDIHNLFLEILKENEFDFYKSLKLYGLEIADLLFESGDYLIYKNKYLYWTAELENKWKVYKKKESSNSEFNHLSEQMEFTKAIIHNLIKRTFINDWDRAEFLEHFNIYLNWLKEGVDYNGIR